MRHSIRFQIIVGFFVLLILMGILSFYLIFNTKRSQTDAAGKDLMFLADGILGDINNHIDAHLEQLQLYARRFYLRDEVVRSNRAFDATPAVESLIRRRTDEAGTLADGAQAPFFTEIVANFVSREMKSDLIDYLTDAHGYPSFLRTMVTNKYGAVIATTSALRGYGYKEEYWWITARDNGFSVTPVRYDEGIENYVVFLAVRIDDEDGNFIGVMRGALDIKGIVRNTELNASRYETMELRLMTPDGRIIYSTLPFVPFEDVSGAALFKAVSGDRGYFTAREGGRDLLVSYTRQDGRGLSNDLDLILAVEIDLGEVLAPIRPIARQMLSFTLVILLVGAAVSLFGSYYVTKPVRELTAFAGGVTIDSLDRPVDPSLTGLRNEVGSLASSFDRMIRDLKQSQERLIDQEKQREREETAAVMINTITESALFLDREGTVLAANDTVCRRLNVPREKLVGAHFYDFFPKEVDAERKSKLEEAIAGRKPITFEGKRFERTVINSFYPICNVKGDVENVVMFGYDVTELKKAQEEVIRGRERYRELVENIQDIVYVVDDKRNFTFINRELIDTLGYSEDYIMSHPFMDFVAPASKRAARKVFERQSGGEAVGFFELQFKGKDGGIVFVELSEKPVRHGGRITEVHGIGRDVTERKRIEKNLRLKNEQLTEKTEELTRSNRDLEQFAYVASHDLQEPLRAVSSFSQLLAQRYRSKLDDDAQEFIGYVVSGSVRMQQLINDLLTFSRVSTRGKAFEETDVSSALGQAIVNLSTAIEENRAIVTNGELPTVLADGGQLTQVFQNLIGNAIKFKGDGIPLIYISAESKDGQWVFSVKDNGIGMEPQYFEKIFVIFQRLHGKDEYPGTGIGLAICKKIVERHGGRIWVESEPNSGSTFFFTLPTQGDMKDESGSV